MAQHILLLQEGFTSNEGIFLLNDISVYTPTMPVLCPTLEILPPGYQTPTVLTIVPGSNLVLNACALGIVSAGGCASSVPCIEDGIYHVRYSVSPNSSVFVEYNILRTTHALNKLNKILCELGLKCQLPDEELEYTVQNCAIIREYLIAAKTLVEDQHQNQDGINIYRFAYSLIEKLSFKRPLNNIRQWM